MPRRWLWSFAIIFAARAVLCFCGFDRRPLLTTNDEAIVQDASVALARGQGLRSPSFEGLEIARLYANHPPVSIIAQAVAFRVFGVSTASIRVPGIFEHLADVLLLGWILLAMRRAEWIDGPAALLAMLLLLFDPFVLLLSRIGRMEQLTAMMGLAGIACVAPRVTPLSILRCCAGGLLIGASAATHPAGIFFAIVFTAFLFLAEPSALRGGLALAMIPLAFCGIWLAAFQSQSVEAWRQMSRLAGISLPPTLGFSELKNAVVARDLEAFKQLGGTAYLLVLAGWLLLACRLFLNSASASRRRLAVFFAAALLEIFAAHHLSLYFARTMLLVYIAIINIALGFSFMRPAMHRVAVGCCAVVFALQLTLLGFYFARLPKHWSDWSPARFDPVVNAIRPEARVASTFELWHSFVIRNRSFRVIDPSIPIDRIFWEENPRRLEEFDVVIFSTTTANLLDAARKAGAFSPALWTTETRNIDEKTYFVFTKKSS